MTSSDKSGASYCAKICWIASALLGLAAYMVFSGRYALGAVISLILALLVFVAAGYLLARYFCSGAQPARPKRSVHEVAATPASVAAVDHTGQSELATTPHMPGNGHQVTSTDLEEPPVDDSHAAPELLKGARLGMADDLKRISGVGPKLEATLNELGFYHFDQIAAWTPEHVAWVDARLKFKGRIERDDWIGQARALDEQTGT